MRRAGFDRSSLQAPATLVLCLLAFPQVGRSQEDPTPAVPAEQPGAADIPELDVSEMLEDSRQLIEHALEDLHANPARDTAWARLAAILDARHLFEDAEYCYRKAVQLDPQNFSYAYMLARAVDLTDRGQEEILALYARAQELDPDYPPLHVYKGRALARLGRLAEAQRAYERALALEEDYAVAQLGLGQALLNLGRPEEALGHLEKAAEAYPEDRSVNAALARAYLQTGEAEKARRIAERSQGQALVVDDKDWVRRDVLERVSTTHDAMHRAEHALAEDRFADAIPDLERYIASRPESPRVLYNLAYACGKVGEIAKALDACERAIAIDRRYVEPRFLAAELLLKQPEPDTETAFRHLRAVLRFEPDHFGALVTMANELVRIGQPGPATRAFDAAYAQKELTAPDHLAWGIALLQLEDAEEAARHFRISLVLRPDFAPTHYNLGLALQALGELEQALQALREAQRLNPRLPVAPHIKAIERRRRKGGTPGGAPTGDDSDRAPAGPGR